MVRAKGIRRDCSPHCGDPDNNHGSGGEGGSGIADHERDGSVPSELVILPRECLTMVEDSNCHEEQNGRNFVAIRTKQ
jgi:hypothetical protein